MPSKALMLSFSGDESKGKGMILRQELEQKASTMNPMTKNGPPQNRARERIWDSSSLKSEG